MTHQTAELMGPDLAANVRTVLDSLNEWPRLVVGRVTGFAGDYTPADRRLIAEFPVPLRVRGGRAAYLLFLPTPSGRVKVRTFPGLSLFFQFTLLTQRHIF